MNDKRDVRNIGIVEEPKGSGRYYVRVYHKGRRYKRRAASKAHARGLREEIRVAIRKGEWPPKPKPKAVLLDDLLKEYQRAKELEGKAILRTDIGYKRLLDRFGGRRPESISAADVEAWRHEMLAAMSPATVNRHLQLLRAVQGVAFATGCSKVVQFRKSGSLRKTISASASFQTMKSKGFGLNYPPCCDRLSRWPFTPG